VYGPGDEGSPLTKLEARPALSEPRTDPAKRPRWRTVLVSVAVVALLAGGLVAVLPRVAHDLPKSWHRVTRLPERVWAYVVPHRMSQKARQSGQADRLAGLSEPEREAVAMLAGRLDGVIVWASNRSGHHQLYLADLHGRSVRQLTRVPAVNFFARIAPNGRQVVFMRSQRESVSVRDLAAWDLYLINVDGTGEQRVAVGAFTQGGRPMVPGSSFIGARACSGTT
jgi:hypothetical protein